MNTDYYYVKIKKAKSPIPIFVSELPAKFPSSGDIVSSATVRYNNFCHGFSLDEVDYIEEKEEFVKNTKNVINCYNIKDEKLLELGDMAQKLTERGNIKRAIDEIVPKMFDRLKNLGYPENTKDVIDINCSLNSLKRLK